MTDEAIGQGANAYPATPELNKVKAHKSSAMSIQGFMEWLDHKKDIHLSKPHRHTDDCFLAGKSVLTCGLKDGALCPCYESLWSLMHEYFGIDKRKVDEEKDQVLEWHRNQTGQG